MGWKNVKQHFNIKHVVTVNREQSIPTIEIGSYYLHDIIVIRADGKCIKKYKERNNEELVRYQQEIDAMSQGDLRSLIESPDTFHRSIPVYTYDDTGIFKKHCEELGWPNVTHDGCMMYENTFSADRNEVIAWAIRNSELRAKYAKEAILNRQNEITKLESDLAEAEEMLKKLAQAHTKEVNYPTLKGEACEGESLSKFG